VLSRSITIAGIPAYSLIWVTDFAGSKAIGPGRMAVEFVTVPGLAGSGTVNHKLTNDLN
jgi:hypothetical protein